MRWRDPFKGRFIRPFGRWLALSAALFLLASPQGGTVSAQVVLSQLPRAAPKFEPITIDVHPIRSFGGFGAEDKTFGKLEWLGGLELESTHPLFGGFSGLEFLDAQTFLAISDRGTVLKGRLVLKDGKPDGVDGAQMRFLPGLSRSVKEWRRDSEGFALTESEAFISFEGRPRAYRYGVKNGDFTRSSATVPLPKAVLNGAQSNTGLEAIALAPVGSRFAGALVLISEKLAGDRIQGWIVRNGKAQAFTLPEQGGLAVTDAAFTEAGDLLILERKVSLLGGLQIRIRRVKATDFRPGTIEATDVMLKGNLSNALDNMEGMAIQPQPDGSSLITLISDDNFNALQRTLLLQFLLPAEH